MAGRAHLVVELRKVDVIFAGGEVYVVVTSPARGARRSGQIVIRLRRVLVADFAGLQFVFARRKADIRKVRPRSAVPDAVGGARLDAGQILSHVDLVDQNGHVHGEL